MATSKLHMDFTSIVRDFLHSFSQNIENEKLFILNMSFGGNFEEKGKPDLYIACYFLLQMDFDVTFQRGDAGATKSPFSERFVYRCLPR